MEQIKSTYLKYFLFLSGDRGSKETGAGFNEAKRNLLDEKSLLTFKSNVVKPLSKTRNTELFVLISTYDLSIEKKGS